MNLLPLIRRILAKRGAINRAQDAAQRTVADFPIPPAFLSACSEMSKNRDNT